MQLPLAALPEGKAHRLGPLTVQRKAGGPRRLDGIGIEQLAHRRAGGKLPPRNLLLKLAGVLGEQELGVRQRRAEGDKVGDEPAGVGFVALWAGAPPQPLGEGSLRLAKGGGGFGRRLPVEPRRPPPRAV